MSLTITNEATIELAGEVAAMAGETVDEAVARSLKMRLEEMKRRADAKRLSDDIMAIAERAKKHWKIPMHSSEHGDLLYGEDGLPN